MFIVMKYIRTKRVLIDTLISTLSRMRSCQPNKVFICQLFRYLWLLHLSRFVVMRFYFQGSDVKFCCQDIRVLILKYCILNWFLSLSLFARARVCVYFVKTRLEIKLYIMSSSATLYLYPNVSCWVKTYPKYNDEKPLYRRFDASIFNWN